MIAAQKGQLDILRALLAAHPPVEVDRRDNEGATALLYAVSHNHPLAVRMLLSHGASIDTTTDDGATLLMYAAHEDNLEALEELLRARSPTLLDAQSRSGSTALSIAVNRKFPRIVDALLAAGADPNIADVVGYTPLMMTRDVEMARRLLDGGADVNEMNMRRQDGTTALIFAIESEKDTSFVALLLERGADVTASLDIGWNSLMRAADMNRVDVMKLLLAADPPAELNYQDDQGQTALFSATVMNSLPSARLLLDAGACPRTADIHGLIPLMRCTSPESIKMMVDAAPDMVNHVCNQGRRALSYFTSLDVLKALFASCARHDVHVDVNHADVNGDTALHLAMLSWSGPEAVKLLLEKGADVLGVGYGGTTVLMKPFLIDEGDHVVREFGIRVPDELHEDDDLADSSISACFEALIHHVLLRGVVIASESVHAVESGGDGGMEVDGSAGDEPAAKRQRR
jgi:ankyrin repeat protein